jgi:hypothetical protein
MANKYLPAIGLAAIITLVAACAAQQTRERAEQPLPQNLIGSTSELQLVTELTLDLARTYGGDQVLVALEIDETLLTADTGGSCGEAAMRPVQDDAATQVERMQAAGLKVIAMTSRSPLCQQKTIEELQRHGFSFRDSAWPPTAGYPAPFVPEGSTESVIYQNGVFMASGQDKGQMLKVLLDRSESPYPALIVLADHDQSELNAAMKAFTWTGTRVQAWRYERN